jgi:type IV pilus assembly protein PilZ
MGSMAEPGDDSDDDERRLDSRKPIELKVEYKRINAFFADFTRNISKGGTFIGTSKPLDVGTEFVFKLFVPNLDEPIQIRGLVKWIVTPDEAKQSPAAQRIGQGEPGMGIRFIYADAAERKQIEEVVHGLMVDSLGQLVYSKLMAKPPGKAASDDNE